MKNVEILAPVGSTDALFAAVRCGADAVYLGQKNFSARKNSQNFDEDELCKAVAYAHRFGVKVHQALNIIVFDNELGELKDCIKSACKAGVDAFIIQDLGVLSVVKELAPDIALHASTQMAIHSLEGVRKAEELGFSRVVLARELSLKEITHIRRNTSLELEVFVHGAHCMCISGQCYMSSVFGANSGNRGRCAQPCRLPFTADKKGGYALSLKDLSLIEKLGTLSKIGIDSVKIEGRMKRPEYVAAAVTSCKKALSGETPDTDTLRAVFSRDGFTSGYFDGNINANMFGFRQKRDVVSANDVLKPLSNLFHKDIPRVPVSMKLIVKKNAPVTLTVTDGEYMVKVSGDIPEASQNVEITKESAEKSLAKLGSTAYFLEDFSCDIENGLFLTASSFNALRRDATKKLDTLREEVKTYFNDVSLPQVEDTKCEKAKLYAKFSKISQIPFETVENLEKIILPLDEILKNKDILKPFLHKTVIAPPRFLFENEEKVKENLKSAKELGFSILFCDNLAHIAIGRELDFKLIAGPFLNLSNSFALKAAKDMGVSEATVSIEENVNGFNSLKKPLPTGLLGYGHIPLMAVRNCPVKAQIGCENCRQNGFITDRMGISFPVRCKDNISLIYNSIPLSVSERQKEFKNSSFFLLDFTIEEKEKAKEVINAFVNQQKIKDKCTRGLYYREV